ncbi:MAG: fumarate hydratase [Oscillospiraceae bacterium]|jgi:fumarate hydratase subunit alpha|nr:fumarate hydratase [Oscillospiraceae bacterium]
MRIIPTDAITDAVARLFRDANIRLPSDIRAAVDAAIESEPWDDARRTLKTIRENADIAESRGVPICQDTGMACVFIDIGIDAHIDGDVYAAVNDGVARGCAEGYLRASIVRDPLRRENTGDNTPAAVYIDLVPGDKIKITVAPKGFGSENMSRVKMLRPADGVAGLVDFVVSTVESAGGSACPPVVVGVGVGGSFDKAALLAKRALLRGLDEPNPDPYYARLERELLEKINALGIGPMGFGGATTALGVSILSMPTHIAGLPAAVNISCHVTRHLSEVL